MTNPVFRENILQGERALNAEPMTINGTINKTFLLLAFLLVGSFSVWHLFTMGFTDKAMALGMVGFVLSIVSFIVIMFSKNSLPIAAPVYAASEGLVLGGISVIFEKMYPGIAIQAISATFIALGAMLFLYRIGVIKCTDKFRSVLFISTLSIAGIYLINFIGSFFGLAIPQITTSSNIGIGFSAIVIVVAALNLIIDFDFIERGSQNFLPKNMEWFGAFGLMVTLVWLYMEILNLLAKLRDR